MIGRRAWLRATATGALLAPLLAAIDRALGPGSARAEAPKRLIVFWNPQGNCSHQDYGGRDAFWPAETGADWTPSPILEPLARHRAEMLLLKGFHYTAAWERVAAAPIPDGNHGFGTMVALTNAPPVGDPPLGGGVSIDQEIARAIGGATLRPSLVLSAGGGHTGNHRGFVSYAGAGTPVVPIFDPAEAYRQVFGAATGVTEGPALAELRALRRSALDLVRDDVSRLRARLPSAERDKLDAQLEAVRLFERELDATRAACTPPGGETIPAADLPTFPAKLDLDLRLATAALACDLTRVVTIQAACGGGDDAPDLRHFGGWAENYHSTGHASNGDPFDSLDGRRTESLEVMVQISRYYADRLAQLVDALRAIPDGEGTLFDNTLIVWCTEMGHGDHEGEDVSFVILGGGWFFQLGQLVDTGATFDHYHLPEALFGDLHTLIARAMGHSLTSFGHPTWQHGIDASIYRPLLRSDIEGA